MRRFLLVGLVGGLLAGLSASPAAANHSWSNYHWSRANNPFTVTLVDSLGTNAGWKTLLPLVSTDWTKASVLDTTIATGTASSSCGAISGRVRVCNGAYGQNGWLGIAQIWVSGYHIMQGTVRVNDTYFSTSTYNNTNAKRHVLCQEVGHTFGLGHQKGPKNKSCMNDQWGLFDSGFVSPNQHDYDQLGTIYNSHLDGTSSSAEAPKSHGNGKLSEDLYVEDLGNGQARFTWVVWVDPAAAHGPPF